MNNPLKYTDPSGNFFFSLYPQFSCSYSGGPTISLTGGIGFSNGVSLSATVGYA